MEFLRSTGPWYILIAESGQGKGRYPLDFNSGRHFGEDNDNA
jgi:hypothetical protein